MKLTLEEISYLSKIFPHKNAIGLLSNVNAPLKGNEQETLTKKGFLENDKFAPGIEEFLAIVAQPESVAWSFRVAICSSKSTAIGRKTSSSWSRTRTETSCSAFRMI